MKHLFKKWHKPNFLMPGTKSSWIILISATLFVLLILFSIKFFLMNHFAAAAPTYTAHIDLSNGDSSLTTPLDSGYSFASSTLTFNTSANTKAYRIYQSTTTSVTSIVFATNINTTVTIDCTSFSGRVELQGTATLRLLLSGDNSSQGITVPSTATITIDSEDSPGSNSGSLAITTGANSRAGIGGNNTASGNITINGGTLILTTTSAQYAAGIGGGGSTGGAGGNTTITGGNITVASGAYGAGIGGSSSATAGNITITGGNVTATGGTNSAGIGGGSGGSGGIINITGGNVTATGGTNAPGIGSGNGGALGTVNISSAANVKAYSVSGANRRAIVASNDNSEDGYYVNAWLNIGVISTAQAVTLYVYADDTKDTLYTTLTLPADYRCFSFQIPGHNAERNYYIEVYKGLSPFGTIVRSVDDDSALYSISKLNDYDNHVGSIITTGSAVLPVRLFSRIIDLSETIRSSHEDGYTVSSTAQDPYSIQYPNAATEGGGGTSTNRTLTFTEDADGNTYKIIQSGWRNPTAANYDPNRPKQSTSSFRNMIIPSDIDITLELESIDLSNTDTGYTISVGSGSRLTLFLGIDTVFLGPANTIGSYLGDSLRTSPEASLIIDSKYNPGSGDETLTVISRNSDPAIGGSGSITINGGAIHATGGNTGTNCGPGIGAGTNGNVTINDGTIIAIGAGSSSSAAAGIGGGNIGQGGIININGGNVTSMGGTVSNSTITSSAIGAGSNGAKGIVNISSTASVKAYSYSNSDASKKAIDAVNDNAGDGYYVNAWLSVGVLSTTRPMTLYVYSDDTKNTLYTTLTLTASRRGFGFQVPGHNASRNYYIEVYDDTEPLGYLVRTADANQDVYSVSMLTDYDAHVSSAAYTNPIVPAGTAVLPVRLYRKPIVLDLSELTSNNTIDGYTAGGSATAYSVQFSGSDVSGGGNATSNRRLSFSQWSHGNVYRIIQSGWRSPFIAGYNANQPKNGTSIFNEIFVPTGVHITLELESIDLIGQITLNSTSGVTLLVGTDTKFLGDSNTIGSFVSNSIIVPSESSIIIDSKDEPGSSVGMLTVNSSTSARAGIGSNGSSVAFGNITIDGGTVTATGNTNSAGIGGATSGTGGVINITNGTVTASGGTNSAGIGGGNAGTGGNIAITGGKVIATGSSTGNPAGIGAGHNGTAGTVNIGRAANLKAYSLSTKPAIDTSNNNAEDGYYVNARFNVVVSVSNPTTLNICAEGTTTPAVNTLVLPANYRCFAYTTEEAARDDNIYAFNGPGLLGQVLRIVDDQAQIYSMKTLAGYNAYNNNANDGVLPVKLDANYKVTYKANNGLGEPDYTQTTNTAAGSTMITTKTNLETNFTPPQGTSFAGWNTAQDSSGTGHAAGANITIFGDTVLYAMWREDSGTTLTITKEVTGEFANMEKEFTFEIYFEDLGSTSLAAGTEFKYTGDAINFEATAPADDTLILDDNGKGTIKLSNGQKIIIDEVPLDCSAQIVETDTDGWNVLFQDSEEANFESGNDTGLREMTENRAFDFTNTRAAALPETGLQLGIFAAITFSIIIAGFASKVAYERKKQRKKNYE